MIVIGASLGGCAALQAVLRPLPADFPLAIAVVLHRHRESENLLAPVLQRSCALPVGDAEDKEPVRPGRVYLAPPDYHLLLDGDAFVLSTDELVNHARPAVDVLFESAAEWRNRSVVGVILTGSGSDGAEGAKRIAAAGGAVLVQDPRTAEGPWMPLAALAAVPSARRLSLAEITAALLGAAARPGLDCRSGISPNHLP